MNEQNASRRRQQMFQTTVMTLGIMAGILTLSLTAEYCSKANAQKFCATDTCMEIRYFRACKGNRQYFLELADCDKCARPDGKCKNGVPYTVQRCIPEDRPMEPKVNRYKFQLEGKPVCGCGKDINYAEVQIGVANPTVWDGKFDRTYCANVIIP